MAEEVEIAKESLDVLSEASEPAASAFTVVSKILGIAGKLGAVFPYVGAVLGLLKCFLPDKSHEEILRCFEKLSNKIDQVRDDIKELEKMIKWDITELQYGTVASRIRLGVEFCVKIGNAAGTDEKMRYQERLKEFCANQNFTLALNTLMDGMTGERLFLKSILDEFYEKTNGDRPKIAALSSRLLQLVCGGMMVIATYETVMRGTEGAKEEVKRFESQLNEVYAKVKSVLSRCMDRFEENMHHGINSKLVPDKSNQELLSDLKNFMIEKYDWLESFCLVYNDLHGFHQHCFTGDRVDSLHHNGKCGIVFYRTKDEAPRFSDRYDEAHKIVDDAWCANAEEGCNNIVAKLSEKGIGWIGCAVITVKNHSDLCSGGNFSTKTISTVGKNANAILLLK